MENIKKNPILMGILNFFGTGAGATLVLFLYSLTDSQESFADKVSHPVMIVLLVAVGLIGGGQAYFRTKKAIQGEKK